MKKLSLNKQAVNKRSVSGKVVLLLALCLASTLLFSSCAMLDSKINSLKGSLIGVSYNAEFYDNYGAQFMTLSGKNIDIDGNIVKELQIDDIGNASTAYGLSSIITITIDGKEVESCGNTVIFSESGLEKDVDFQLSDISSDAGGLTSVAKVINKYKNYFGKSRVVVIQSQLGVPICAYSGNDVYWEIPNDLPKMTKLMIDGKALYIHRANFEIIDRSLLN